MLNRFIYDTSTLQEALFSSSFICKKLLPQYLLRVLVVVGRRKTHLQTRAGFEQSLLLVSLMTTAAPSLLHTPFAFLLSSHTSVLMKVIRPASLVAGASCIHSSESRLHAALKYFNLYAF